MLTNEEKARYARHFVLPNFGVEGQEKLKASSVLCIGAGGLGSPALLYLAAAGVGRIGIVDDDRVEVSNLQRQVVHASSAVGRLKVESAAETLRQVNPHVQVEQHPRRLTADLAQALFRDYDVILDGCDNFATRYLTSDVCTWLKKPNIYASIQHFEGQLSVFAPHLGGPCYRCLVPQPPAPGMVPSCAEAGVLGVLPGILGSLQATEALKLLTGLGQPMVGRLLHVDTLSMAFREFKIKPDPECPACGQHPKLSASQPIDYDAFCGAACVVKGPAAPEKLSAAAFLKAWRAAQQSLAVVDVREVWEAEISPFPGAALIPLGKLPTTDLPFSPETTLYTLCKADYRSLEAARILHERGWTQVSVVQGGMDALSDLDNEFMPY